MYTNHKKNFKMKKINIGVKKTQLSNSLLPALENAPKQSYKKKTLKNMQKQKFGQMVTL